MYGIIYHTWILWEWNQINLLVMPERPPHPTTLELCKKHRTYVRAGMRADWDNFPGYDFSSHKKWRWYPFNTVMWVHMDKSCVTMLTSKNMIETIQLYLHFKCWHVNQSNIPIFPGKYQTKLDWFSMAMLVVQCRYISPPTKTSALTSCTNKHPTPGHQLPCVHPQNAPKGTSWHLRVYRSRVSSYWKSPVVAWMEIMRFMSHPAWVG